MSQQHNSSFFISNSSLAKLAQLYRSGRLSQSLLWLACLAGVAGLLASRALVALSPAAAVLAALLNPDWRAGWRHYWRNGAARRAALLYILLLVSGLYTSEWDVWRHEAYRLLPWLAVPLAFTAAVPLSARQRLSVGRLFVLGAALVAAATLAKYLLHPAAANESLRVGQSMWAVTKIFHIHFGIMLVLAFFGAIWLRQEPLVAPWLRWLLALAAAVVLLTLHVLAYRTGLLVLYAVLLLEALRLLFRGRHGRRRWWLGLGLLLGLAGAPWLAYQALPSIRARVGATEHDLIQFRQGRDINHYSLSRRLAAWETALVVAGENPWLGVGPADTRAAMMRQYDWRGYGLTFQNRAMIHNQYLHFLVGGGALGLGLWLLLLGRPLAQPAARRNPYIRTFLLTMAVAMLVDSLLEVQIGYNLFVFGYGFLVVAAERQRPFRQSARA